MTTINPATGKEIQSYDTMTNDEMNKAIESCHEAFLEWKMKPAEERAKIIVNIGNILPNRWELFSIILLILKGKNPNP